MRRGVGSALRSAQSQGIYRAVGKRVAGEISITMASPADLAYVHSRLSPGIPYEPAPSSNLVTRFVAMRSRRVTGFVELVRHPPEHAPYIGHWLFSLNVLDPWCRGLGIGEALARHVVGCARREGARELWLVVGEANGPAIALYRKLGFERAAVVGLEELLEEEARTTGKRRITMVHRMQE